MGKLLEPRIVIARFSILEGLVREKRAVQAWDEKIHRRHELSAVIAKLHHISGARIHEIRIMEVAETTITINKGKGGRKRVLDFSSGSVVIRRVKSLTLTSPGLRDYILTCVNIGH